MPARLLGCLRHPRPQREQYQDGVELDEYVFDALRYGASGFLLKDTKPGAAPSAIRLVAEGEALLSPSVTGKVVKEFVTRARRLVTPHPQLRSLTDREREIRS
jgi:DNA-binding NarL/FixJ family response regulator